MKNHEESAAIVHGDENLDAMTREEDEFYDVVDHDNPTLVAVQLDSVGASLPHPQELVLHDHSNNATRQDSRAICFRGRYGMRCALGATLFVLVVVILSISIPVGKNNNNSSQPALPLADGPRNATTAEVIEYLVVNNVSDKKSLQANASSPQFQAAFWIAELDKANLRVPTTGVLEKNNEEAYMYIFRYVMALNFFAMGGADHWETKEIWMSGRSVCFWQYLLLVTDGLKPQFENRGIFCNETTDEGPPTELRLDNNNLTNTIPTENGLLTSLTVFDMKSSQIGGSIPTQLCHLTNLEILGLSDNDLTGELPTCLGSLTALKWLYVGSNRLEGTLPKLSPTLKRLVLEDNLLTGSLASLRQLSNLEWLYADRNAFEEKITGNFLQTHSKLVYLDLSNNNLTIDSTEGVPTHLFSMRSLEYLDLSYNPLHGRIPVILSANITNNKLKFLSLQNTNMTGALPLMQQLAVLQYLDLSQNDFRGSMHKAFANMPRLESLFVSDNEWLLADPVPPSLKSLIKLKELSLRNTNRQGPLPTFLGSLSNLVFLDLGSNNFTSAIPPELGQLKDLEYLLLNDNPISQDLPSAVSDLPKLKALLLDGTLLSFDFNCQNKSAELLVYVDCFGTIPEVNCTCCHCCYPGKEASCSDPLLANVDASWEDSFDRTSYKLYADGDKRGIPNP
jgi:Leucine-rich repeat (LRR) protein